MQPSQPCLHTPFPAHWLPQTRDEGMGHGDRVRAGSRICPSICSPAAVTTLLGLRTPLDDASGNTGLPSTCKAMVLVGEQAWEGSTHWFWERRGCRYRPPCNIPIGKPRSRLVSTPFHGPKYSQADKVGQSSEWLYEVTPTGKGIHRALAAGQGWECTPAQPSRRSGFCS